jgi:hypothetical protein
LREHIGGKAPNIINLKKWIPNETSGPGRDKPAPGHRPSRYGERGSHKMKMTFRLFGIVLGLLILFPFTTISAEQKYRPLSAADKRQINGVVAELRKSILNQDTKGVLRQISVSHGLTCTDTDYSYKDISKFLADKNSYLSISFFETPKFQNKCGYGYPDEFPAISEKEFLKTAKESVKITQIDNDSVEVIIESPIKTHYPRQWYLQKEGKTWKATGSSFIIGNCTCG